MIKNNSCFKQTKINGKEKVYELTTNARDGFRKHMVRGIKDDECAREVAKKGFGKYYSKNLISYYDDSPSEYNSNLWKKAPNIKKFLNETEGYRK